MPRINKPRTALKELSNKNVDFDRIGENTWVYYTSGYNTGNHQIISKYLNSMGFMVLTQDFDKYCGKTRSEFKKVRS